MDDDRIFGSEFSNSSPGRMAKAQAGFAWNNFPRRKHAVSCNLLYPTLESYYTAMHYFDGSTLTVISLRQNPSTQSYLWLQLAELLDQDETP